MKLTKYEHSCVVLEQDGQSLVIDPGGLSSSFVVPKKCIAVFVSHEHFDHLDQKKLHEILAVNPELILYTNTGVLEQLDDSLRAKTQLVEADTSLEIGEFSLQFTGSLHEEIREEVPRPINSGVIVNKTYYHPGDEHYVTDLPYTWLGLALNAPWSRVKQTNQFIKDSKAANIIPIHDGLLNTAGLSTYENHIKAACEIAGSNYQFVPVGETIELK